MIVSGDSNIRSIEKCSCPFPHQLCDKNTLHFDIKKHTKVKRIVATAKRELQQPDQTNKKLVFKGLEGDCAKCIATVELLKNQMHEQKLYQWNVLVPKNMLKYGNPGEGDNGQVPVITIMISTDPFPENCLSQSQQINDKSSSSFYDPTNNPQSNTQGKPRFKKLSRNDGANKWRREKKKF